MTVSRRPETFADEPFLHRLLIERTRQDLALDHVPAPLQEQLLTMQVNLRLSSIRGNYAGGSSEIIMLDDQPAGWLFLRETEEEVQLVEVVVLGEFRGQGIGTATIGEVVVRAGQAGKPVRLRVNVMNTGAFRLYERLGFQRIGGDAVQHEMERKPS